MTAILTRTASRPQAGLLEDMEREDNRRGFERDETDNHHRLGTELLRRVRAADARIPAERRAPRTVAQMRARLAAATDDACPLCGWWRCRCADQAVRAVRTGSTVAMETNCPNCNESNESGSACKRCGF
ncbi:hypothetical protein [Streptomyces sp. URMC 125]|uniref:hypothetical protein n=1 Tax=Streptomyces sp. URMC 125 TaxID=3423419 RepID=UPI003F1CDFD0